jgi:hypothetical protein
MIWGHRIIVSLNVNEINKYYSKYLISPVCFAQASLKQFSIIQITISRVAHDDDDYAYRESDLTTPPAPSSTTIKR